MRVGRTSRSRACAVLLGALLTAAVVRPAGAQATGAVLPTASAYPRTYAGNCPVAIEFIGHVTVTVPGTVVTYQWERSNGTTGKVLHAQIGQAARPGAPPDSATPPNVSAAVSSDKWWVGFPGRGGLFSEKLHILAPVEIRSSDAAAEVNCRV